MALTDTAIRYAVATGRADRDPAADLRGALPPTRPTHRAGVTDPKAVGALLRAIRQQAERQSGPQAGTVLGPFGRDPHFRRRQLDRAAGQCQGPQAPAEAQDLPAADAIEPQAAHCELPSVRQHQDQLLPVPWFTAQIDLGDLAPPSGAPA